MKTALSSFAALLALCLAMPAFADGRGCFWSQRTCLNRMARALRIREGINLRAYCRDRNEIGRFSYRYSNGAEIFYRGRPRLDIVDPDETPEYARMPDIDRDACLGDMAHSIWQVYAVTLYNYCQSAPGENADGTPTPVGRFCYDYAVVEGC